MFGSFNNSPFLCDMKTKQQTPDLSVLLSNKEYAEASYNYFFLLGCGKKSMAAPFLKEMKKIEKSLAVSK